MGDGMGFGRRMMVVVGLAGLAGDAAADLRFDSPLAGAETGTLVDLIRLELDAPTPVYASEAAGDTGGSPLVLRFADGNLERAFPPQSQGAVGRDRVASEPFWDTDLVLRPLSDDYRAREGDRSALPGGVAPEWAIVPGSVTRDLRMAPIAVISGKVASRGGSVNDNFNASFGPETEYLTAKPAPAPARAVWSPIKAPVRSFGLEASMGVPAAGAGSAEPARAPLAGPAGFQAGAAGALNTGFNPFSAMGGGDRMDDLGALLAAGTLVVGAMAVLSVSLTRYRAFR